MDPDLDLSILNPQPANLPGPNLLHELVTASCEAKALEHLEAGLRTSYTYDELHRHADAIASRLSRVYGYHEGQPVVPVLIEQSPTLTLVSVRRSEMLSDLPGVMNEMDVDACELTPTVAGSLLRTRGSVPGLKLMLTIGEMLTEPVTREFGGDDEKDSILWAMYGPTEATIHWTGDKARILPDGTLECLGRLSDGQVKLRGQRLELGEVQQAILRTPGCHGAIAAVQDSILVAFCATDSGVLEDSILEQCQKWLPRFMIPGEFVLLNAFPKLPSGKVDKRQLIADFAEWKEDNQDAFDGHASHGLPDTLVTIVGDVLETQFHGYLSLASAGLDSLKAIKLASSLRAAGFPAEVGMLLKAKTVSDVWLAMQNAPKLKIDASPISNVSLMRYWDQIAAENPPLSQYGDRVEDVIPCIPLQSAMLFETVRQSELYWNEVELEADTEIETFVAAFQKVAQQNQILRTGFAQWKDAFVAVVFKEFGLDQINVVDNFRPNLSHEGDGVLLRTLQMQIRKHGSGRGLQILLHMHHAIYDGWSTDMLLVDLSAVVQGSSPLQRPPFRKLTEFYHSSTLEGTHTTAKTFWADRLMAWTKDPFPKLLDYSANSSSPEASYDFLEVSTAQVEQLSKSLGCSVQVFFQTSLALVWSGIIGSTDIVFGTVTSGRALPLEGIEKILGPFIASLPLRVDFRNMTETVHLLNHIQAANRAMLDHSALPLSEIRKLINLQPGDTLYDVLFVFQQSPESEKKRDMVVREVRHLDRLETKIVVEVEPRSDGFAMQMTWHPDSMTANMAECFLNQFKTVLGQIFAEPHSSLISLKRCLSNYPAIFNESPTHLDQNPDLASMFESTVARDPQAQAICFARSGSGFGLETEAMTYDQLNMMSNQIAHFLLSEGTGTREVVAIIMEKSITLYASILGIVKAGCAYLPLLPSTPIDRVRDIFGQAKIRHYLVDEASGRKFSDIRGARLVNIETAPLSNFQDGNLEIPADGSRLAYVIYTSGTTGTPKGVAITQLNIASNIYHLGAIYPKSVGKQSRLLQACSQAFDVSVFEIFYAWHAGMCLCAGTNDTIFEDLEHSIRELQITHLSFTPTVASLIKPEDTPSVEFLVTAGEPMTQAVLDQWGDLLWQGYGPSETTNICSVKKMQRGMPIEHLGWAFPNTSVFVLFPNSLDTVPFGWVGEFCFGGDQVAQGYLNMPQTTTDKFIRHPKYGRVYRSGDIGRMLPDGSLMILGRIDDQLKLRGQRIEAGEICSIIISTRAASSAVAMLGRRHSAASDQLIAFYVLHEDTPGDGVLDVDASTTQLLFSTLQSRLPSYMIPSYLIPLARIPLTSSGKLHRRRLQEWFKDLPSSYLEATALPSKQIDDRDEWSQTETLIAGAIAETMGVTKSDISRWAPFANLGIDSVSAIGLASHLSRQLGRRVNISSIIRNPNLVQLGRYLDTHDPSTSPTTTTNFFPEDFEQSVRHEFALESKTVETVQPCTPLQEAMLSGAQRSYFNKVMLRLQVSDDHMREYWTEMGRRHEILRTCFVTTSDMERTIAQVVLRDWEIPWQSFNVTTLSFDAVVEEHLQQLPQPVDSKTPPVSLAAIYYRGSTFLSFICHHALYDGVAIDTLWREVEDLSNGLPLPPPVLYGPFLREMLTLPDGTQNFWKAQLHDFCGPHLCAKSAGRNVDQAAHKKTLRLPLDVLQRRVRDLGVSMLALCQGAWANTLSIAYSTSDVCFGNVVSGRSVEIEGIDRLVAPCFNTVPIRLDLSTKTHGNDLVKYCHRLNSDILPYQFTPLRLVQKLANRQGRGLFDTLLLLQPPLREMDDQVWILDEDSGDMDVPLVCEVVPCPNLNAVIVKVHYDMNVVDSTPAIALVDIFEHLLERVLDAPYAALTERDVLPADLLGGLQGLRVRQEKPEATEKEASSAQDWTDMELEIRRILAELSGQPSSRVHQQTTIFQLGLDSINAVQVASLLRRGGLDVSASDVMEYPSCSKLADHLSSPHRRRDKVPKPSYDLGQFARDVSIQARTKVQKDAQIEAILPCTPIQCAMVTSFIQSGGQNYFNSLTYEMGEHVELGDLIRAWQHLASCHPMLRTTFIPVTHPHTSFSMLRYTSKSNDLPLTTVTFGEALPDRLAVLDQELRDTLVANPHIPPWHLLLHQSDGPLTMTIFIHHALYDAQSLDSILLSLSDILQGGNSPQFPGIEPSLADIMSKSLGDHSKAEQFWKGKSQGAVVNSFPVMTPLREPSGLLMTVSGMLSMPFSELQIATQDAGISVQALIQAAWTRILSSYLGESSIVFGVTLSGRTVDATRDAPFPCLVTLPVVASSASSNADLLRYMMDYNTQMHKTQSAPLSQVQKWLGHAASPVFDTLVSYRKPVGHPPSSRPFSLVADNATIDYPLSLEIEANDDDSVQLSIVFKPDTLPHEQARLMILQFDAILSDLALHPNGTEDKLHPHVPELFSQLPPENPDMESPVQYLHDFVSAKAISHPDSCALEFVDSLHSGGEVQRRRWTYRQLDEMGNRVANLLAAEAPEDSIVAIHFDKSPEAYFSILGILKAGCSFVALDPTAPEARKRFILEDSQAPCVLVSSKHALGFEIGEATNIVEIAEDNLQRFSAAPRELGEAFTPSSTCYCLYTSGTTGTPKGCEITHENAVQAMMAFQELFRGHWDEDSRWLQFAALHFDVSVLEQYWSWSVGITVVAAPKDMILDDLIGSINKLEITHIDLTPSLARLTHPDEVPSLCKGVFITGGESLKQEILDVWGPKAVIYNAYGPTEATIGVTMYQRVPITGRPSNIGKQFSNVGSYVFQPGTETPVLRGGVGELCVSGKLVGKGYLGRPELTHERFPTLSEFNERVYRTGDLVRLLYDGCFDFLGRADDQVKLRGQRLEIGEINHAIRSVPGILDAATIVTSHGSSDKNVLVSFIVAQQDGKSQDLRVIRAMDGLDIQAKEACRSRLPGYMVPTYCLQLPYIPLSVNNKAEVKELKRLFSELSHEQLMGLMSSTSSSSTVEAKTLENIICVLAEFSSISKDEILEGMSIFDIGVDSISAPRLASLLKDSGFVEATTAKVLRNPMIQDLAWVLSRSSTQRQSKFVKESQQRVRAFGHRYMSLACRELGTSPSNIEYIAPCSPLQEGIISKALTLGEKGAYFNSFELSLGPTLQPAKIRQAWDDLIASEPILRTKFLATSSGFVQISLKHSQMHWKHLTCDTKEQAGSELHTERQNWVHQNATHISDPLELIHVQTPTTNSLHIHIFHAIYDGNSFDLMLSRIASCLRGNESGAERGPSFLQALSYGPLWSFDHCRTFWTEHLRDWVPSSMPSLSSTVSNGPVVASRALLGNKIDTVRKTQNVTLQSVLLALWTSVLQQHHPAGLTTGVIVSGRSIDLPGVEHTIGPLFNTVPFFNTTLRAHTWASLVQRCHDFGTTILPFQHVPLQKIQKWLTKGQPLFDTLFTLQSDQHSDKPGENLWELRDGEPSPDYPLAVEFKTSKNGTIHASIIAQGHIANQSALESLLDQLELYLELMARHATEAVPARNDTSSIPTTDNAVNQVPINGFGEFAWTPIATTMRETVAVLAGVDTNDVGESTSMLELGLDSIDIIKLSAKLRGKQIEIAASQIMRLQTVARMAEAELASHSHEPVQLAEPDLDDIETKLWTHLQKRGLDMSNIEAVLPATPLQESMVAAMVQSGFEWYFNHDVLEVCEGVDLGRLKAAWTSLVEKLLILRTGFIEVQDEALDMTFCQIVYREQQHWREEVVGEDLAKVDEILQRAKTRAKEAEARRELFQMSLLTIGSRNYIVLSIAHALYDGWSLGLIYRELQRAYDGSSPMTTHPESLFKILAKLPKSESENFWADYLGGTIPSLVSELSTGVSEKSVMHRLERTSSMTAGQIHSFCKKTSISLQALCQACWAMVLARWIEQLDVTFGVVMSGRDFEGAEDLVFPTMNTVAFRCILHGTAADFLQYLEENLRDVRDHQSYPLRKAQLAAKAPPGGLFNSLFLLQKASDHVSSDTLLKSVKGESAVDYPVCVEAEILGDSLVWRTACQSQFVSEAGASDLMDTIDQVMGFFTTSPDSELLSFSDNLVSICGQGPVRLRLVEDQHGVATEEREEKNDWSGTSITIREVLSQVSGIPDSEIKLSQTLYHLGLDSISAIKVSSMLRRRGLDLTPRNLIAASSISHMADIADNKQPRQISDQPDAPWEPPLSINLDKLLAAHGLTQHEVSVVLPALPMQVYMLGTWQKALGTVFYPDFTFLFEYDCSMHVIAAAWEAVVKSTPMLRTCFVATDETSLPVLQVVLNPGTRITEALCPMVAFRAERDQEKDAWVLQLRIHHALYDGISLPAIMQNLAQAIVEPPASTAPDQAMARWIRYTTNPTLEAAKTSRQHFWTGYLGGCPRALNSESRTDYPIERVSYIRRSALRDSTALRQKAAHEGLSVQSLFLAAYAKVLLRREAAHDICNDAAAESDPHGSPSPIVFGIYLANRGGSHDDDELLPASYPRLNLVPLRVDACGGGLEAVASAIQRDLGEINSGGRADVGLWEIDAWTGVRLSSFVNFLSLPDVVDDAGGPEMRPVDGLAQPVDCQREMARMGDIVVKDSFPPAIDVEASLHGDGLDIGVFGPSNLLAGDDAASDLVAEIVTALCEG
ncbi:NRPS [Amphichorda felina]